MASSTVPLIAIDGPGGVGKSSVARALAGRLGYFFLSSGLIYRAMAWHLRAKGWRHGEKPDPARLEPFVLAVTADGKIEVNGAPVVEELHSEAISRAASLISALPAIRQRSDAVQRETVARIGADFTFPGVILEGRDIGTVVFPDATHKFFFTASPEVRAERRYREQRVENPTLTLSEVRKALQERDERDSTREVAPLKPADDAHLIDTSSLDLEGVVERIMVLLQPGVG